MTQSILKTSCDDPLLTHAEDACAKLDAKLIKKIGSGNSASVYKVTTQTQNAALKIYQPRFFLGDSADVERRRVLDQMRLRGHGNPYLIDFLDAGEVHDTFYLLMEYFPWQSIDQRIDTIVRSEIATIISKIARASEYLETRGFVHRDIKPANVLLSDDCKDVKLLDLGVIRTISTDESDHGTDQGYALPFVATAQYSSPAYLFRDAAPTEDMWKALTFYQLGGVLHDLLMAYPLFDHEIRTQNRYRVAAAVASTTPEINASDVSPWLVSLARNCLVKEDSVRLSRVSWNSFHVERRGNLEEMRRRLGLRATKSSTQESQTEERYRQERLKVKLDNSREVLTGFCRHVLRRESFPTVRTRKSQSHAPETRRVLFAFSPTNALEKTTQLHFILQMSVRSGSEESMDIFIGTYLTKCDGQVPQGVEGHLLWTARFDDLEADEEQLLSILEEELIVRYQSADDELRSFEESGCKVLEVSVGSSQNG